MSDGDLPAYVERPGEQVFGPPYVAQGARLYLFFVDGEVDHLNDLIDKSLNTPLLAHFGVTPAFQASRPKVIFMFAEIPRMYSDAQAYLDGVKQHHRENKLPTAADVKVLESTLGEDYVQRGRAQRLGTNRQDGVRPADPRLLSPLRVQRLAGVDRDGPRGLRLSEAVGVRSMSHPRWNKPNTIKLQTSHIPNDTKKPAEYKSRPLLQISPARHRCAL